MFEDDRSSLRGQMAVRKLIIFKHSSKLGNASSSRLFDLVEVAPKEAMSVDSNFKDYEVMINREALPKSVKLIEKYRYHLP